ncbi:MAG: restriction endonuclease subunit S [Bacteroidaceae bacterium]
MKEVAIKDICKKDSSALKQKELLPEGKYPVFGASGIAGYLDRYHQKKEYIGIVKDGSGIGRVAFYPAESSLIGTMQYVLPKENYDIRYIGYCLQSLDLSKYKQGAAIPHIYFRDYGEQLVKVTDNWEEQHSIVSRLDSAFSHIDALKANAEKQLNEARKLFQAELTECMRPKEGWEEKTLPKLSENLDSIRKPVTKKDRTEGIYPYYGASGIVDYVDNYLFDEDLLCISEDGANLLMRTYPIAFPISGKAWVNNHAHVLRFKCMSTQRYVEYYFAGLKLDEYITGAAQPKLTQKALNSIIISIPSSLAEQSSIVSHLNSLSSTIRKLEELQQKTIAECDALKQAMLREVFE